MGKDVKIFNGMYKKALALIVCFEAFSLLGHYLPIANKIGFFVLLVLFFALAVKRFELAFLALCVELFISSKGYLFFYNFGDFRLSIRISFWLVLVVIWVFAVAWEWKKTKKFPLGYLLELKTFRYFVILFVFVLWGLINGLLNGNALNSLFFDFNGWLYFALLFPVSWIYLRNKKNGILLDEKLSRLMQVFSAAVTWLCIKTFALLYIFSHEMYGIMPKVYKWIRVSGVGEITKMEDGFYRIFFQSHIFVLILVFFLLMFFVVKKGAWKEDKKLFLMNFALLVFCVSTSVISLSRSNWLGFFVAFLFFSLLIIVRYRWRRYFAMLLVFVASICAGLFLIVFIVQFSYPDTGKNINAMKLVSDRASEVSGESAVSSRWSLLPVLTKEIMSSPVLGYGFGKTITYKSDDPRVVENNPGGEYSTYAFEWGWLDVWLKIGLFGFLAYLYLLFYLIFKDIRRNLFGDGSVVFVTMTVGLVLISVISFFSPYFNHPLGIGFLLMATVFVESCYLKNEK